MEEPMNERPSVLQVLENVTRAWLDKRPVTLEEAGFLAQYIAEEKAKTVQPAPAAES
jgi:uncharacterized protein YyaL (SSP411 family)